MKLLLRIMLRVVFRRSIEKGVELIWQCLREERWGKTRGYQYEIRRDDNPTISYGLIRLDCHVYPQSTSDRILSTPVDVLFSSARHLCSLLSSKLSPVLINLSKSELTIKDSLWARQPECDPERSVEEAECKVENLCSLAQ